jgi:uncharacterized protein (TIGR03086 family)
MPTPAELYVQAMAATQQFVDGVAPDRWNNPTPCSEWNVTAVVDHLVNENLWAAELFTGKTIAEVGGRFDGDLMRGEPAAAYGRSVGVAKAAVEAPGAMEAVCHLSFGDCSGAFYATQLFMDFVVHGWDIAKGSGQDAKLDPGLVAACLPYAETITRKFRAGGWYGDELSVPARADPQTRLLALFGRRS